MLNNSPTPPGGLRRSFRSCGAVFGLLAVVASGVACQDSPVGPPAADDTPGRGSGDASGLSVGDPQGGNGLYAPRPDSWTGRWSGSLGGHILCSVDGTPLTLQAVRYNAIKQPASVVGLVRTVPSSDDRRGGGGWSPIGSALGSAPEFAEPYSTQKVRGTFVPVAGVVVDRACSPRDSSDGYQEFVTVMTVDETGGHLESAEIDYEVDGDTRTLTVEWEMSACGTDIDQSLCPS